MEGQTRLSLTTSGQDTMQPLIISDPEPLYAPDLLDILDTFLASKRNRTTATTQSAYRRHYQPFRRWWQDHASEHGEALSPDSLEAFYTWLRIDCRTRADALYSPQSVYTTAVRVRQFLNWIRDHSAVTVDISQWMPLPPQPTIERRFLSVPEIQALFDGLANFRPFKVSRFRFRDAALLALLVDTGARRLELASALQEDVHWHGICQSCGALTMVSSRRSGIDQAGPICCGKPDVFYDRSGHIKLRRVKKNFRGEEKAREVVFGPVAGAALRLHLDTIAFADLASANAATLFGMSDTAIRFRIDKLSEATGIYCHAHAFRYTMSDYWQRANRDRMQATLWLKVQLGHAIPRDVTFVHYTDLSNPASRLEGLRAHRRTPMDDVQMPDLWNP